MNYYEALKAELIAGHPGTGAYDVNDQLAADQLNVINRTRNRTSLSGKEVKDRIDTTEWDARTDAQKQIVLAMCNRDDLDPFGIDAQIFQDEMAGATNSLAALATYRVEDISRGQEIGYSQLLTSHDVYAARSI